MKRFIEGEDRSQVTLLPECLDDFIAEDDPVRVVDAFVEELDLQDLGFEGAEPAETGRPSYHPAVLLKIYIYGYLNRIQSSRRLEREAQRNVELMWLTGRLTPNFKTIADFRRDNGAGIRNVCRRFVALCRDLKLFSQTIVAIDSSKFKAVNSRDRNFTPGKIDRRQEQIEQSVQRYLDAAQCWSLIDGHCSATSCPSHRPALCWASFATRYLWRAPWRHLTSRSRARTRRPSSRSSFTVETACASWP